MELTRRSFVGSAAALGHAPFAASWLSGCGEAAARSQLVVAAASTPPSLDWGRTYTFSLRRGWPSHAGNELTATDVTWTFDRSFAVNGITSVFNRLARIKRPADAVHRHRRRLARPGVRARRLLRLRQPQQLE